MTDSRTSLHKGDRVKVKCTDMVGTVKRVGPQGLLFIDIETEHSTFDRSVYGPWELEVIK